MQGNQDSKDKWCAEYHVETVAPPEVIWHLFCDVPKWKEWNAGIEKIEMCGAFTVGTEFVMTPPGQEPLLSRLIEVRENVCFVDETCLGELTVVVTHRIDRASENRTRVTYAVEATGPGCEAVGPAVSSDFPHVLKSLVQLAEANP